MMKQNLGLLVMLLIFEACSSPPPELPASPVPGAFPDPLPVVAGLAGSSEPVTLGVLTSVDGEVSARTDDAWKDVDVGDAVPTNAILKTGNSSSCEVQFGHLGILHLASDTVVDLKRVHLATNKKAIDLELISGAVTAKVAKLLGDERFVVRTGTVVAGVRGTRFTVTRRPQGRVSIAVAEGLVALLPPTLDQGVLDELVTTPDRRALVQSVVELVMDSAVTVGVGMEVDVTPAMMAPSEEGAAQVVQALTTAVEALPSVSSDGEPAKPTEVPASVSQVLASYRQRALTTPLVAPRALSEEAAKALEATAGLKVLDTIPSKVESLPTPVAPKVPPSLKAPRLLSPRTKEVVDIHRQSAIFFRWNPVAGATDYRVRLQSLKDGQLTLVKEWTTTGTSVSLDTFDNVSLGDYEWEVVAQAAVDSGQPPRTVSSRGTFVIDKDGQLSAPTVEFN